MTEHKDCPHCGTTIAATRWPQHVKGCSHPRQQTLGEVTR